MKTKLQHENLAIRVSQLSLLVTLQHSSSSTVSAKLGSRTIWSVFAVGRFGVVFGS